MTVAFSIFLAMFLVPPFAVGLMGYCYVNDIDVETGVFWLLVAIMAIGVLGMFGVGCAGIASLLF